MEYTVIYKDAAESTRRQRVATSHKEKGLQRLLQTDIDLICPDAQLYRPESP